MPIEQWVKEITEDVLGGAPFSIGDIVSHPSGRQVQITGGQYWAADGFSNFWCWREVLSDGTLSPSIEHGYGWRSEQHSDQQDPT